MTSADDTADTPEPADSPTEETQQDEASAGTDELSDRAAAEPVDTEQLERAQRAIDEGHEAAAKALDPPPDEQDLSFANVKQNDDPDAADNAVPRPN